MAATVINSYSDAYGAFVNNVAQGAFAAGQMPPSNNSAGKLRVGAFTVTLASQASGEDIACVRIPKGARLLGGDLYASTTLANSATLAVGLAATDGTGLIDAAITGTDVAGVAMTTTVSDQIACLKAAAAQGATKVGFCLTSALGYGYVLQKECWLTITTGTGTVATEVVRGEVRYVVD